MEENEQQNPDTPKFSAEFDVALATKDELHARVARAIVLGTLTDTGLYETSTQDTVEDISF